MSHAIAQQRSNSLWQQKRTTIFRFFFKMREGWFRLLDADIRG